MAGLAKTLVLIHHRWRVEINSRIEGIKAVSFVFETVL